MKESDEQHQATSRVLTVRDPNVKFNTEISGGKVQPSEVCRVIANCFTIECVWTVPWV